MYILTESEIEFIFTRIESEDVQDENLKRTLLDHICCIVENEFETNYNFEEFIDKAIIAFYSNGLNGLESDLNNLSQLKKSYMKKFMMALGLIAVACFLSGSIFKILNWQEPATAFLYSAILVVSFLFLPAVGISIAKGKKTVMERLLIYCGTVVGIFYFLSMFLLLKHSELASIIWIITLVISLFIFTPLFYFTGIKKPELKFNTSIITLLIIVLIGLQFSLTNLRPNKSYKTDTIAASSLFHKM